ncbi:hypothetical protein HU200_048824 [Digitaria exilis]|uniref:EF-hand domain-containing protein n=1 Tax=Digitaria exilis TaxID=1010633 RepID=A0A835EBN9_9POAL|nr:hypothetical protein HU200_048824 [Digitaria exilis]
MEKASPAVQTFKGLKFISKGEAAKGWDAVSEHFDRVDKNADGRITEEELKEIIIVSASTNRTSKIQEQADEYARLIMDEMDPSNQGYIELEDMETLLQQALSQSVSHTHRHNQLSTTDSNPLRRWCRRTQFFLEDNWRHVCVIMLWLSACAALFAWRFIQYRHRHRDVFEVMGYCVCVAKGSAETLKLNMALVLLPVCRNTITWIRTHSATVVARVVPFDYNVNFHMVVAGGIAAGAGVHVISHMACGFPRLLHATDAQYEPLGQEYLGFPRPKDYWWFLKGIEGWTGLVMLVLMVVAFTLATPWFRRDRLPLPRHLRRMLTGFNAFWYSHHCFVVVYVLLVVHGQFVHLTHEWYYKSTWMYVAVPVVLYAFERLVRVVRSTALPVKLLKAELYSGNVLSLHLSKPQGFQYTSGQYIFLNCPAISRFECRPKVLIEGPYGLTAQDYKQYDTVLLVSLGIGVAAMISIIRDIIDNIKEPESDLESGATINNSMSSSFPTRRAYFCWITREEGSFEWFREVMDEVAEKDKHGVIEFHNYCTSLYEKGDARSAVIAVLQFLNYAMNGVDVISNTRIKTHFARPNWYNVYKRIALNHPNQRVGVFYCGAPVLVNVLRELAQDFSRKTSTKFEFHKEYF